MQKSKIADECLIERVCVLAMLPYYTIRLLLLFKKKKEKREHLIRD